MFANLRADVRLCACESNCVACASLVGDVTITPEADASASLVSVSVSVSVCVCECVCV